MRTMPSIGFSVAVVVATLATLVIGDGAARADLAPPDSCSSPGQPCQNAGAAYNQAGSCVATTCTKQVRSSDGGLTPMTYSCNACELSGATGSGGAATGSGGAATGSGGAATGSGGVATGSGGVATGSGGSGTGGTPSHTSGGSSGCAVGGKAGGGDLTAVIALGLVGLALISRRRTSV